MLYYIQFLRACDLGGFDFFPSINTIGLRSLEEIKNLYVYIGYLYHLFKRVEEDWDHGYACDYDDQIITVSIYNETAWYLRDSMCFLMAPAMPYPTPNSDMIELVREEFQNSTLYAIDECPTRKYRDCIAYKYAKALVDKVHDQRDDEI